MQTTQRRVPRGGRGAKGPVGCLGGLWGLGRAAVSTNVCQGYAALCCSALQHHAHREAWGITLQGPMKTQHIPRPCNKFNGNIQSPDDVKLTDILHCQVFISRQLSIMWMYSIQYSDVFRRTEALFRGVAPEGVFVMYFVKFF